MSCRDVRDWLHRGADALDEAQRLSLDDHLAACVRCRGDRARMRLLHGIGTSLQAPPLHAREYNRAIARALLEGGARTDTRVPPRRRALPFAVAAAAAAATAIAWIAVRGDEPQPAASSADRTTAPPPPPTEPSRGGDVAAPAAVVPAPSPVPAHEDRIESGALRDGAAAIASGAAVPANTLLGATAPARLRLGAALVVVAAGAELRWVPAERAILLERGTLDVETEPDGVARVVTARFEVEVGDASLTVEPAAVHVRRGAARIVDRATRAIVARLESGGSWTPPEPAAGRARPPAPRGASPVPAARWLAEARARFAARDHAAAERAAEAALASGPSRTEAAEARTLLADVAQASGDLEQAVTRYLAVATELADLPAAESALYAAARIELRRARRAAARALLTRYLDRYPSGRYAGDVRRHLTSTP